VRLFLEKPLFFSHAALRSQHGHVRLRKGSCSCLHDVCVDDWSQPPAGTTCNYVTSSTSLTCAISFTLGAGEQFTVAHIHWLNNSANNVAGGVVWICCDILGVVANSHITAYSSPSPLKPLLAPTLEPSASATALVSPCLYGRFPFRWLTNRIRAVPTDLATAFRTNPTLANNQFYFNVHRYKMCALSEVCWLTADSKQQPEPR
jgi:hypothetical protein